MGKESLNAKVLSEVLFQISKTVTDELQRNSELIKSLFSYFCQYLLFIFFIIILHSQKGFTGRYKTSFSFLR